MARSVAGPGFGTTLRTKMAAWVAAILAIALVVTAAVIANGVQTQQTELHTSSVWAVNGRGSQFAQVNIAVDELETVRAGSASDFKVAGVLQDGSDVVLYSDQQKLAIVDPANPQAVTDAKDAQSAPLDADVITPSGGYAAFFNRSTGALGATAISVLARGGTAEAVNRTVGGETERYVAGAVTEAGRLTGYTAGGELVVTDVTTGKEISRNRVDGPGAVDSATLTTFGSHWALLVRGDASSQLWIDGRSIRDDLSLDARLARADSQADQLVIADGAGLHSWYADGSDGSISVPAQGVPAQPTWQGTCLYAAWGTGSATTASTCGGAAETLEHPDDITADAAQLVVRQNRDGVVLNDVATGLIWVRDGDAWKLIRSSVGWQSDQQEQQATDTQQTQDATQNQCPVPASGDAAVFGVRPGQLTTLPVLVGATDPNRQDVLALVPSADSPKWTGSSLGDLAVVNDNQSVSVNPTAASGSATFSYVLTDGSECRVPAEATVEVHPEATNEAPVYRSVNDQSLADLQVAPGGSLRFNGLSGWVDPDGDPVYVIAATASAGQAAATADGTVAYKADDDQASGRVTITVQVTDGRGGVAARDITITVSSAPLLKAQSFSRVLAVNASTDIDLGVRVSGTAGGDVSTSRVQLTRVTVPETLQDGIRVVPSESGLSVNVTPTAPGLYPITYEVRSGAGTATATLMVSASSGQQTLSTPPITVYLRHDEDVTVDPLAPVVNPGGGVLIVGDASGYQLTDPRNALSASVVNGSSLRVSGQTFDGAPGRIGTFRYAVRGGDQTVIGQATVFLLDENVSTRPVAVADQVTVRAGTQVDIPVLANDVAPAGGTLTLDPRESTDDLPGLAFASGSVLRYLATDTPGSYTLHYRVYSAGHPGEGSIGTVNVQVVGHDGNQAPRPKNLDARVLAGQSTFVTVDGFGVDPDGDDISVVSVTQPSAHGSAQVTSDGRIQVISTGEDGPIEFDYTVADTSGATGTGHIRVGVITGSQVAPVAYNDYVEVAPGQGPITIDPTLNDARVSDEQLQVVDVTPVVSQLSATTPDTPVIDGDSVTLTPQTLGKTVYRYTVRSSGGSQAVGSIVLNVTNDALPVYPVLVDTVVGGADIDGDTFSTDVLSKKLVWSGEPLTASLRQAPSSISLSNGVVSGALAENRQVIALEVRSGDAADAPRTWAFVKVPAKSALRPQLRNPGKVYEIGENAQLNIALGSEVTALSGRTLQVNSAAASGSRSGATCSVSGLNVAYNSSKATSTTDGCSVEVQWADDGGSRTVLYLPISVTLDDPPPVLRSQQIGVVDPATKRTIALSDAVQWAKDKSQLQYTCGPINGAGVTATCVGGQVTVEAAPDAQQGAVVSFEVAVSSPTFQPQPKATLTVQVGVLPRVTLTPAALSLNVSEGDGATASGSIDALAANGSTSKYTPLTLTGVDFSGASGVSATTSGSSIQVSVAANTPGGVKSGTYQVRDAQGNTGQGRIEVNYQARPGKPRVALSTVGNGAVTLRLGDNEVTSVPGLTGFTVTWGSGRQNCPASGICTISGLHNQEHLTFTVVGVNAVGESKQSASVTGWAYKAPEAPQLSDWHPTGDRRASGTVTIRDPENVIGVEVTTAAGGRYTLGASGGTISGIEVNNAATTVTAVAKTADLPTGLEQRPTVSDGSSATTAFGVGTPTNVQVSAQANGDGLTATVTARADANGGEGTGVRLGIAEQFGTCSADRAGTSLTQQVSGSTGETKAYVVCAISTWGGRDFGSTQAGPSNAVIFGAPPRNVQGTYTVGKNGNLGSLTVTVDGQPANNAQWIVTPGQMPTAANPTWTFALKKGDYQAPGTYTASPASGSPAYPFSTPSAVAAPTSCELTACTVTLPTVSGVNASDYTWEVTQDGEVVQLNAAGTGFTAEPDTSYRVVWVPKGALAGGDSKAFTVKTPKATPSPSTPPTDSGGGGSGGGDSDETDPGGGGSGGGGSTP